MTVQRKNALPGNVFLKQELRMKEGLNPLFKGTLWG